MTLGINRLDVGDDPDSLVESGTFKKQIVGWTDILQLNYWTSTVEALFNQWRRSSASCPFVLVVSGVDLVDANARYQPHIIQTFYYRSILWQWSGIAIVWRLSVCLSVCL